MIRNGPESSHFDWEGAETALYTMAVRQLRDFFQAPESGDTYGFGFFCDSYQGGVYVVANTNRFHQASYREYVERFGPVDNSENEEMYRWNIGNWEYPAGLLHKVDPIWEPYRLRFCEMTDRGTNDDENQLRLEAVAGEVLRRLVTEGAFDSFPRVEGFTVLGPDVPHDETVLKRKCEFDCLVDIVEKNRP